MKMLLWVTAALSGGRRQRSVHHAEQPLEKMHWALREYSERYGSMEIEATFETDETWPVELRGMRLGRVVEALRELEEVARSDEAKWRLSNRTLADRRHASLPQLSKTRWGKTLTEAGFDWGSKGYRALVAALRAYKAKAGNLILPRNFRVPSDDPSYPRELAGVNLDRAVYCLRFYRDHVAGHQGRQRELRELGFLWPRLQPEFNLVVEALVAYEKKYGDMAVPVDFCAPFEGDDFPDECKGMPLGRRCAQIRSRHDFANDASKTNQLDSMGFVWNIDTHRRMMLKSAQDAYRTIYDSPTIPLDFVVPDQDRRWPKRLRGFQLGRRSYDDARKKCSSSSSPQRRRQSRFDDIVLALSTFVDVHRHADVPQKFVVPSCAPWPTETWGMMLGHKVAQIRSKGYYLKEPGNRDQLDNLGFVWAKRKRRKAPSTSTQ